MARLQLRAGEDRGIGVTTAVVRASRGDVTRGPDPVTLVDLLDRVLGAGVVVHGKITLSLADIDLVDIDLALLVAATATLAER